MIGSPADFLELDHSSIVGTRKDDVPEVGVIITGEGMEAVGLLELPTPLGWEIGRGYHFPRPLPESEMNGLLAKYPRYV